jgi:hypothetical protein
LAGVGGETLTRQVLKVMNHAKHGSCADVHQLFTDIKIDNKI